MMYGFPLDITHCGVVLDRSVWCPHQAKSCPKPLVRREPGAFFVDTLLCGWRVTSCQIWRCNKQSYCYFFPLNLLCFQAEVTPCFLSMLLVTAAAGAARRALPIKYCDEYPTGEVTCGVPPSTVQFFPLYSPYYSFSNLTPIP